jgi:hypothetical protein
MTETARDGKGRWIKGEESYARDAEAFRLRARGWTLERISDHLGYGGNQNVHRAVKKAVTARTTPAVDELRHTMDEQLDQLYESALKALENKHIKFHQGEVLTYDGDVVVDDDVTLRAIKVLLDVQERRAKLWGADAPAKQEVEVTQVKFSVEGSDEV